MSDHKWYLGKTKPEQYGSKESIYLEDFEWACDWYWAGGYLGNSRCHFHFDGAFLDVPDQRGHPLGLFVTPWNQDKDKPDRIVLRNGAAVWEDIETFLDNVPPHISRNWWRIKDLFKQFYAYKSAAACFHSGGHCSSAGRKPQEIKPVFERSINLHIEHVIIPEIRAIFDKSQKVRQ